MTDITPTPGDIEAARQFVERVKSYGMTIREVAQFRAEARQAGAARNRTEQAGGEEAAVVPIGKCPRCGTDVYTDVCGMRGGG